MMTLVTPQAMIVRNFMRGQRVGAASARNNLEGRNNMMQLAVTMTCATDGTILGAQTWIPRLKIWHK